MPRKSIARLERKESRLQFLKAKKEMKQQRENWDAHYKFARRMESQSSILWAGIEPFVVPYARPLRLLPRKSRTEFLRYFRYGFYDHAAGTSHHAFTPEAYKYLAEFIESLPRRPLFTEAYGIYMKTVVPQVYRLVRQKKRRGKPGRIVRFHNFVYSDMSMGIVHASMLVSFSLTFVIRLNEKELGPYRGNLSGWTEVIDPRHLKAVDKAVDWVHTQPWKTQYYG
jgi:hypothetical protein